MKKFFKKKLLSYSMLAATFIVAGATSVSAVGYKTNSNLNLNLEKKFTADEINLLGFQSRTNFDVLNWIADLNFEVDSFDEIKNNLFKIKSITDDQKIFMYQNLVDKHNTYLFNKENLGSKQNNNTNQFAANNSVITTMPYYFDDPSDWHSWKLLRHPKSKKVFINKDGNSVFISGQNSKTWEIYDYAFADDVSYLFLDNQEVLNGYLKSLNQYEVIRIRELINKMHILTKFIASLTRVQKYHNASVIKEIQDTLSKLAYNVGILLEEEGLLKSLGLYRNDIITFQSEIIRSLSLVERNLSSSADDFVKNSIPTIARSIARLGNTIFIALGSVTMVVNELLSWIPTHNGYTVMENMHDHGLNDFRYQLKYNYKNMMGIAKEWSEDYKYGIVWKVTDGWFTVPELYIATQKDPNHFKYKNLSPNDEFNWGHHIPFVKKGNND